LSANSSNFDQDAPSEIILLAGTSGVGKSALAQSLRYPVSAADAFFVDAKFEQNRLMLPFTALTAILSDLCDLVVQDAKHVSEVRGRMQKALSPRETGAALLLPCPTPAFQLSKSLASSSSEHSQQSITQ